MKFTKMHGCGNDYIYINGFEEKIPDESAAAVKLSDRHFGIGSDGLIIIKPSEIADFEMCMYNADGSRGAMCGNGIRCVAKYVFDNGLTDKKDISIESMGVARYVNVTVENGKVVFARVDMGAPVLAASLIPVAYGKNKIINENLNVGGIDYKITCVSMGNPHCVVFTDKSPSDFDLKSIGPLFENNSVFPDRINTEFAFVKDRKNIEMRVWERGSGET
ncbi:MAG: diaminopimelate epimerase, partial [Clostridiales bacterium]|nr:diaminopimelate epimerase [Clostridiales bacterium]